MIKNLKAQYFIILFFVFQIIYSNYGIYILNQKILSYEEKVNNQFKTINNELT